jgi:hypothetical protein
MRVTDTVRTVVTKVPTSAVEWLLAYLLQTRLTVESYLTSIGVDAAGRKKWASAFGRMTAKLARKAGFEPTESRIAVTHGANGRGWTQAMVYPHTGFFGAALVEPDAKGRTYVDKMNIGG